MVDPAIASLVGMLVALWILVGGTAAGFAHMFGGSARSKPTARFFFVRPFEILLGKIGELALAILKWPFTPFLRKKKKKKKKR